MLFDAMTSSVGTNNTNNNGNGVQSSGTRTAADGPGIGPNGCPTPPTPLFHHTLIDDSSSHRSAVDMLHPMTPTIDTPHFGQNGIGGMGEWELSPGGLSIPLQCNTPLSSMRLPRTQSLLSNTSQRYCHDPYSLSGSQRLSLHSNLASNAVSPADCQLQPFPMAPLDDSTGPLTVTTVAPAAKGRHESRGRRKGRADHSRNSKPLEDVPPPTSMRYLPPPPPSVENLEHGIVSPEALQRCARRWYERTTAAESSYVARIQAPVWFPAFVPMPQSPQSFIAARQAVICPRMDYYSQYNFWQWLSDAEQWWETTIRPLTGVCRPQPPPYVY